LKASSLIWVRLNSVQVIRAARPTVARQFIAAKVGYTGKLKSLDDLEPHVLETLNHLFAHTSNDQLETQFLEHLKGKS
jgi:hypothetical protein